MQCDNYWLTQLFSADMCQGFSLKIFLTLKWYTLHFNLAECGLFYNSRIHSNSCLVTSDDKVE